GPVTIATLPARVAVAMPFQAPRTPPACVVSRNWPGYHPMFGCSPKVAAIPIGCAQFSPESYLP
ncbi:MAG TPA: hypothetical protein PK306_24455, partial [Aquabacterium sp.]|nr:hypothetical protein [Aquabacterium sp.]